MDPERKQKPGVQTGAQGKLAADEPRTAEKTESELITLITAYDYDN